MEEQESGDRWSLVNGVVQNFAEIEYDVFSLNDWYFGNSFHIFVGVFNWGLNTTFGLFKVENEIYEIWKDFSYSSFQWIYLSYLKY